MASGCYVMLTRREYDVYCIGELEKELQKVTGGATIDFAEVLYFDSTAIGTLIRCLKKVRELDGTASLTLTNVSISLCRTFAMLNLSQIFTIEPRR